MRRFSQDRPRGCLRDSMTRLTVLSPHRDDAVFSLYLSLQKWCQSGVRVSVVNFFTVSNYAPKVSVNQTEKISLIRKTEDHDVLSGIHKKIRIQDSDLLDAPLRLGIGFESICRPETQALARSAEPEIAAYIRSQASKDLLIAPLGLGGHVDHLAVYEAAIASVSRKQHIAFYEDLPYAIWTGDKVLRNRVLETETKLHVRLKPVIIRQRRAAFRKQRAAAGYKSQITPEEASSIARFSFRYRGGERLWVPKYSKLWKLLTH